MTEFWEASFQDKQAMWGQAAADCVAEVAQLFMQHNLQKILVPGFGYGRNARVFADSGMQVTGIEIYQTAIGLAKTSFGEGMRIHHGSVTDMPFDEEVYDGVFCYALIHLIDPAARAKLIKDCFAQLRPGGLMIFVAISTQTSAYGEGDEQAKDTFRTPHGVTIFYYDSTAVHREFGEYGLLEAKQIAEPAAASAGRASQIFWQVTCAKTS